MLKSNADIGFIGLGVMGKSMAKNLLMAGYRLNVYTRTRDTATDVLESGAIWKDSVAEVARDSNVIITIVGFPADVREVYFGESGIIQNAHQGSYVIDMTTSRPSLARVLSS